MFTKKVYFIRDKKTGNVWSYNRWGTPDSTPDIYASERNAQYQIDGGKLALMVLYGTYPCDPEIVCATLTEVI